MRGWDAGHDVDAELLRDLLLRRGLDDVPGPREDVVFSTPRLYA